MYKLMLGTLLFSTALVSAGNAAVTTLADLIATGGTVVDGDKVFSNFSYSGTGSAPSAADVNVQPFTNAMGDYGIEFTSAFTASGGGFADSAISYQVTVTDPHFKIDDASAISTGTAVNGGFWDVGETLVNGTTSLGTLTTFEDSGPGGGSKPTDHITFSPVGSILVVKDVGVHASSKNGGFADLSVLDQNFSQTAIPEQETWAMMALGFAGLGVLGYRRAQRPSRALLSD